MGVVDHAPAAGPAKVFQGLGEEHLAPETVEGWVILVINHTAVTEHQAGVLDQAHLVADLDPVGRRVVLHFFG